MSILNNLFNKLKPESFSYDEETGLLIHSELVEKLSDVTKLNFYYLGPHDSTIMYLMHNNNYDWKIQYVFQIGYFCIFPDEKIQNVLDSEYFSLFIFTRNSIHKTIIGFNDSCYFVGRLYGRDRPEEFKNAETIIYNTRYFEMFRDYFSTIEKIITKHKFIELNKEFQTFPDDFMYEFIELPSELINLGMLMFPDRYRKSFMDVCHCQKDESCVFLREYLDDVSETYKYKKGDLIIHSFYIDKIREKFIRRIRIADKDGVVKKNTGCVFRVKKNISVYYLYNYLNSDFIKNFCLKYHYCDEEPIWPYPLDLPLIVNPEMKDDSKYFEKKHEMENQKKSCLQKKVDNRYSNFYSKDSFKIMQKDLNELRNCFNVKAYKAAIILAGSILEAFLIDWLSEKENKDYFNEDYMVYDKYRNRYKRADLIDYINAINELEKPNWMDAANKATQIRKKRNLIHAKLYINDSDISKESCTEVIDYLDYVINTRWNKKIIK